MPLMLEALTVPDTLAWRASFASFATQAS